MPSITSTVFCNLTMTKRCQTLSECEPNKWNCTIFFNGKWERVWHKSEPVHVFGHTRCHAHIQPPHRFWFIFFSQACERGIFLRPIFFLGEGKKKHMQKDGHSAKAAAAPPKFTTIGVTQKNLEQERERECVCVFKTNTAKAVQCEHTAPRSGARVEECQ